jgi:hypothetical protein
MNEKREPQKHRIGSAYPADIPEALGESGAFIKFCENLSRVAPIERPCIDHRRKRDRKGAGGFETPFSLEEVAGSAGGAQLCSSHPFID